jgi:tetratricopeptide (TPR) repeat protein
MSSASSESRMSSPSSPRRHWGVLGVALLLVLGAAAGGWWWLRPAPPRPPLPAEVGDPEVQQALELARQGVLDQPRSAAAWGHYGLTLLAHLFDRDATACFVEAGRLDPADPRWPYARGLISLKRDPNNALPLLRQAAGLASASPELRAPVRLQLAEALQERGEAAEAEEIFRAEHRADPGSARAALGLGLTALERGDLAAAEPLLRAAAASAPARKKATAGLAALARARGELAAARKYDKDSMYLPEDPTWPDPLMDESIALRVGQRRHERELDQLESAGQFKEALERYLQMIEERPTGQAYAGAGLNLFRLGDYPAAVALLRRGARREPDSASVHGTLAQVVFAQAAREHNREPGCAAAREGFAEVLAPARRATELKPDHALAYLFWGLALKYLGRPREALEPLRRGVACRPEDFELQLGLGEALLEAGLPGEARAHLDNARRLEPDDPRPARALERLDRAPKEGGKP